MWETRTLLPALLLVLSACNGDSGQAAADLVAHKPKPAVVTKKGPSVAEQTLGMVLAASPARSEPIAELKFELRSRPVGGRPLVVDLALLPQMEAGLATIDLKGGDGLAVADGDAAVSFADVIRNNVYRKSVTVTPAADGMFYLNATAPLKGADFSEVRDFTIPIIAVPAVPAANEPKHKGR